MLLAVLIAACGEGSQTPDTSTSETKVAEKTEVEPIPNNEPAKPAPPRPNTVRPTTTPTPLARFTLMPTSAPTLPVKPEELYNPDETEAGELNNLSQETPTSNQQDTGAANQKTVFWNERDLGLPGCTNDFKFSHQLANPEDVQQI